MRETALDILGDVNRFFIYNERWGCRNGNRIHVLTINNPATCTCTEGNTQLRGSSTLTVCAHTMAMGMYTEMIAELLLDLRFERPHNIRVFEQPGRHWPQTAADLYSAAIWLGEKQHVHHADGWQHHMVTITGQHLRAQ